MKRSDSSNSQQKFKKLKEKSSFEAHLENLEDQDAHQHTVVQPERTWVRPTFESDPKSISKLVFIDSLSATRYR